MFMAVMFGTQSIFLMRLLTKWKGRTGEHIGRGHGVALGPRAKTKGQIFPVRPVRYLLYVRNYSLGFCNSVCR